ncbi:MAG TPA: Rpp14/Pop5 family protein [Candidatus Bathyarchaeia archaeon]|nr:Rpp14/Pop5 family protein [Candidatus Bathyarchaeia archaeon]
MNRRRYLALKIEPTQEVNESDLENAFLGSVSRLFGEYGVSKAGLVLLSHDPVKNCAVLRCTSASLDMVKASLASITNVGSKPAAVHILGVSGTLKSLRGKFLYH